MLIQPLNFGLVTKTPSKLFYWPIYSPNYTLCQINTLVSFPLKNSRNSM